jgi:Tfp pilus assembly PilM family ATPase
MEFPFFNKRVKRRDQVVAVDLGTHTTKGVYLQRQGEILSLAGFAIEPAPQYDRKPSAAVLAEHLKKLHQALASPTKAITLILGVDQSLLRQVEMFIAPISEMRTRLRESPKNYLQQDLGEKHVFDCYIAPATAVGAQIEGSKAPTKGKILVGGAEERVLAEWTEVIKLAALIPDQIVPNMIGPINALERAQPVEFGRDALAVVDLGFKNSTISIVKQGELMLNRVVGIGGEKLTLGLQDAMGVTAAEAENLKVGMPQEVASALQPLLLPLGRELRASIDFFEHQHDKTVSQVYVCGAAAQSPYFVQALQEELMAACKTWSPAGCLGLSLPPQQLADLEKLAPQLAVAIGVAVAAF